MKCAQPVFLRRATPKPPLGGRSSRFFAATRLQNRMGFCWRKAHGPASSSVAGHFQKFNRPRSAPPCRADPAISASREDDRGDRVALPQSASRAVKSRRPRGPLSCAGRSKATQAGIRGIGTPPARHFRTSLAHVVPISARLLT